MDVVPMQVLAALGKRATPHVIASAKKIYKQSLMGPFLRGHPKSPYGKKRLLTGYETARYGGFAPGPDGLQTVEHHMRQKLNKSRRITMGEFFSTQFPVRTVRYDSSYQMGTGSGTKMTCMNVFRHQDLSVLEADAATNTVLSSLNAGSIAGNNVVTDDLYTTSGYVMRGYGVQTQATPPATQQFLNIQGQMYIGPGNHVPKAVNDPTSPYAIDPYVFGARDTLDPQKYVGLFIGVPAVAGSVDPKKNMNVVYPSMQRDEVDVGSIMGMCQTLWSPICAQSIEAAAANLGFDNGSSMGTVNSRDGYLNQIGAGASIGTSNFGPQDAPGKVAPRAVLDPSGTQFTWQSHTVDYKFTNTYSYPLEVNVVVYKAFGLQAQQTGNLDVVGQNPETVQTQPRAYYPGVNGPLPWNNKDGGIFSILTGLRRDTANAPAVSNNPKTNTMYNRCMILDLLGGWQERLLKEEERSEGIVLPDPTNLGIVGSFNQPKFQSCAKVHWPLLNSRWGCMQSPKGVGIHPFMKEFSRSRIKLVAGERSSLKLDLGGFKYCLKDIGYLQQNLDNRSGTGISNTGFIDGKGPIWSSTKSTEDSTVPPGGLIAMRPAYKYCNRGMMNGSVVVVIELKGTAVNANAPVVAVANEATIEARPLGGVTPGNTAVVDRILANQGQPDQAALVRGNYATGTTTSPGTLLVECKETVSFQPMMSKRPYSIRNTRTHTDRSVLCAPAIPVSQTVRTIDEISTKAFTKTAAANNQNTRQPRNVNTDKTEL